MRLTLFHALAYKYCTMDGGLFDCMIDWWYLLIIMIQNRSLWQQNPHLHKTHRYVCLPRLFLSNEFCLFVCYSVEWHHWRIYLSVVWSGFLWSHTQVYVATPPFQLWQPLSSSSTCNSDCGRELANIAYDIQRQTYITVVSNNSVRHTWWSNCAVFHTHKLDLVCTSLSLPFI